MEKPVVNIPSKIFSDIYYLHSKYQGKEWSGHLYYNTQGDLNNPNELIIDVKEFVLLDLGSAAFTEIDPTGEQLIEMYDKRPQILTMKHGCIHTHHNMRTFFSGTDTDTLLENAANYNFFLSVIVNNAGDTIAKISLQGFIEEPETTNLHKFKFGKGFIEKIITKEKKVTEIVYVYDCIIKIENSVEEEFDKLLKAKEAKFKIEALNSTYHKGGFGTSLQKTKDVWEEDNTSMSKYFQEKTKTQTAVPNNQMKVSFKNPVDVGGISTKHSIKDSTIGFLTALILQDADLDFAFNTDYQNAISSWEEEVGIELLLEYKAFVTDWCEPIFDDIFGSEITKEELRDIKINVAVILGESIPEQAIKPIVEKYLDSIK